MDKSLFNLDEIEKEPYFIDSDSAKKAHLLSKKESKFVSSFITTLLGIIRDMGKISELYLKGKYFDYLETAYKLLDKIEDYGFEIFVAGRELVIYYDEKLVAMRTGGLYEAIIFPSRIMNQMRKRVEKNCTQDYVKDLKRNIKRAERHIEENPPKDEDNQMYLFE